MGRVETHQEAYAVARARRALNVFAGVAALGLALVWLAGPLIFGDFDNGTYAAVAGGIMFAYLAVAYGVGRCWTPVWALALLTHGLSVLGTGRTFLSAPRPVYLVSFLVEMWVVSRLLDPDAVRVFLRVRRAPAVPAASQPVWHAPVAREAAPRGSFDFFGA
ncbi:MAG TPA: hypothetical protein VGX28_13220 [Frankiaceae bacterium]|jgi:hypothetical protein|nr:hypothetical protein [Frankiaceae bacterium]